MSLVFLEYDEWISAVCMTQFTKPGTHLEQHSMLNNFFLELQYCAVFRRESRKFAGEVWQYAKFRHFLANRVVKAGPPKNPINNFSIHTQCPPHGLRSSCAERASITMTNAEADVSSFLRTMWLLLPVEMYRLHWQKQSGKVATTMYWETFETTCKYFFRTSSSRMRVIYYNWSATKQRPHPQSVAEVSHHSVLSGDRIRQCETSSGSRHKDTDQCL